MHYNFDEVIDRTGTHSLKYEGCQRVFGTTDILPMWVADMDFRTPDFIVNAMKQRMDHEIFGYTLRHDSLYQSVVDWMWRRHRWKIEKEWIVFTPGVVPALNMCMMAYSERSDEIVLQSPVYYPFFSVVELNKRRILNNQLLRIEDRYTMDFDQLRRGISPQTKMMILCSPHNPVSRVWEREELAELAEICSEHKIIMIADEIHADLILDGYKHIPFATINDEAASYTVTCIAPSKTFNIAGLSTSALIIPNPELRKKFNDVVETLHIAGGNIFGFVAMEAAYSHGDEWLKQALAYINGNVLLLEQYIFEKIPNLKVIHPEGTYMAWIDFSGLGMTDAALRTFMIEKVKLGLNSGPVFGAGGEGFQRINLGCPRSTLMEGLNRLAAAIG